MVKNHIKSLASPKSWPIKRKKTVYLAKPTPQGHKLEFVMPISIVFKDMLKFCKTTKEVIHSLKDHEVFVDGKRISKPNEGFGFMSVLSIPSIDKYFRMLLDHNGRLKATPIDKKESDIRVSVINNKTIIGKDKVQLNFSDGKNIIIKKNDYKTGDSLILSLPNKEIKGHIKLEKGTQILLSGGKQVGNTGVVDKIEGNTIYFLDSNKNMHETHKKYAYPIGNEKLIITI